MEVVMLKNRTSKMGFNFIKSNVEQF